jgi:hypothetical protein
MGGAGSGRYSTRATTGAYSSVDVRLLQRHGALWPGSAAVVTWTSEQGEVQRSMSGRSYTSTEVELSYVVAGGRNVGALVSLTTTACHFGRSRPWFLCPGCERRVALLYLGQQLRCRRCLDLAYESTRQDIMGRLSVKQQKIRRRLGGSANLSLPQKPKGMHSRTFSRLALADQALSTRWAIAGREWMASQGIHI